MTKSFSQQQTLTIEHDQKIRQQQRLTFLLLLVSHLRLSQKKDTTLPPKKYGVAVRLDRSPSPGSQSHTG